MKPSRPDWRPRVGENVTLKSVIGDDQIVKINATGTAPNVLGTAYFVQAGKHEFAVSIDRLRPLEN